MFLLSPQTEGSRTPPQHKNKPIQTKVYIGLLVRWKGLEPPTYWFVAVSIAIKQALNSGVQGFCRLIFLPNFHLAHCLYTLVLLCSRQNRRQSVGVVFKNTYFKPNFKAHIFIISSSCILRVFRQVSKNIKLPIVK